MKNSLPIAESFYSIQGEGTTTGHPAVFVRLAGCNLMCGGNGTQFDGELHNGATWRCDTVEVWMQGKMKPFEECLDEESKEALMNGANLIMTGGEPMMNQVKVTEFVKWVRQTLNPDVWVEIETNGTIPVTLETQDQINQYNCSPKLSNSGNDKNIRFNQAVLDQLNHLNTQFKFVLTTKEDWEEVQQDFSFLDRKKIWLMPSGENQELLNESKQTVAEIAKQNYLKYTNRLHIEIWNQKTGV